MGYVESSEKKSLKPSLVANANTPASLNNSILSALDHGKKSTSTSHIHGSTTKNRLLLTSAIVLTVITVITYKGLFGHAVEPVAEKKNSVDIVFTSPIKTVTPSTTSSKPSTTLPKIVPASNLPINTVAATTATIVNTPVDLPATKIATNKDTMASTSNSSSHATESAIVKHDNISAIKTESTQVEPTQRAPSSPNIDTVFASLSLPNTTTLPTPVTSLTQQTTPHQPVVTKLSNVANPVKKQKAPTTLSAQTYKGSANVATSPSQQRDQESDVDLIAALVAHDNNANHVAKTKATKPANTLKPKQTLTASAPPAQSTHLLANADAFDDVLAKCEDLGFLDKSVCRWSACADHWGKSPACPINQMPSKIIGGSQ